MMMISLQFLANSPIEFRFHFYFLNIKDVTSSPSLPVSKPKTDPQNLFTHDYPWGTCNTSVLEGKCGLLIPSIN